MSSCAVTFPNLCWALPVGPLPETRARAIAPGVPAYIIPGARSLASWASDKGHSSQCIVVFAHGGAYARGEARMYIRYMERWVRVAAEAGIDLAFVSVEYCESAILEVSIKLT